MTLSASILYRLQTQHLSLPTIIKGLNDDRLERNIIPGKWSIRDNIAHLTRYQPIFLGRINTMLSDLEPVFESYRAENDQEFDQWLKKSSAPLMDELNESRNSLVECLTRLNEKELGRCGVHPNFGRMTILDWTEFFLLHESHHLFTIFRLAHMPG